MSDEEQDYPKLCLNPVEVGYVLEWERKYTEIFGKSNDGREQAVIQKIWNYIRRVNKLRNEDIEEQNMEEVGALE